MSSLSLDAEALYTDLLAGVRSLWRPDMALLGIWSEAMVTLSLVLTSLAFCLAIGLPLGIVLARSDRAQRWMRPFLDAMQTTPAFVYLVPVVMLFGIGNLPGVVVTIVFALPPLVRLTNLGIRQVRPDLIEAARAYGASPWQMLVKVQLPLAMPSIMAGINQALMLSLSMVVIASMIAVGGLTDFAAGNNASILRTAEGNRQYSVRLKDLIKRGDVGANVEMKPGDILIIPQSLF